MIGLEKKWGSTFTMRRTDISDMIKQLHRLSIERRPEACLGCGLEHGCSVHGCTVINRAVELLEAEAKQNQPKYERLERTQ